ncbi:MAG: type II toxin-antitoxin system PemK/MazF family toxin [Bifidobacterium scardovii]|uniref:type II toxin-antitoxin system PemK/MazF family toxin n=1 Tax=Bifidobacterium scardovii TaxID=158787 RepID=UPI00066686F4|nr:type II toxin-antitoxin system PemK/MazF family toxin [Bifidobacterium scardovii]MBS6947283.1 type II toxin-antitoxin system PemK/MazF family toxin [Bifidobacterium scardovii]MDU3735891.1 type II toxin-antitoxin system PemK/MazF family toxin [Bifidobacterium scardovii]MDU5296370.1 type II toxin-antitoxin system PemK/MazF family toxin [Bifidobacterium scardovii]MDU5610972.1 type II toxin-antitoxin system PemK/MazF family toxin [Bifidobacterium scardovii]MDU5886886.1 type II toxin-antitoxin s
MIRRHHYGDVVWADLDPTAGHEQNKRRPLIVVSNDEYNRYNNLVMTVPITSNHEYPLHINVGLIPTEDGGEVYGWAEIEQAKSLDLDARNASKIASLEEETMERITVMLLSGLMRPSMRIERIY